MKTVTPSKITALVLFHLQNDYFSTESVPTGDDFFIERVITFADTIQFPEIILIKKWNHHEMFQNTDISKHCIAETWGADISPKCQILQNSATHIIHYTEQSDLCDMVLQYAEEKRIGLMIMGGLFLADEFDNLRLTFNKVNLEVNDTFVICPIPHIIALERIIAHG